MVSCISQREGREEAMYFLHLVFKHDYQLMEQGYIGKEPKIFKDKKRKRIYKNMLPYNI